LAIVSVLLRLLVVKHARWFLTYLIPEKPNYPIRPDQTLSYAQRVGYLTRKADRHLQLPEWVLYGILPTLPLTEKGLSMLEL